MVQITSSQLRAARALLNWSRADLANFSGISEPTIHRYENNVHEPEVRTSQRLFSVFDRNGVEFLDHQGVRFKSSAIDLYDGVERFDEFYNFLYEHLDQYGGDVCINIYNETLCAQYRKNPNIHRAHMRKLHDQGKITFRILTTISAFEMTGYAIYRWLPKQPASLTGFYAFGDCLALMSFVDKNSPQIVVMRSSPLAEGYRQNFNIAWQLGVKPPSPSEIAKLLSRNLSTAEIQKIY